MAVGGVVLAEVEVPLRHLAPYDVQQSLLNSKEDDYNKRRGCY